MTDASHGVMTQFLRSSWSSCKPNAGLVGHGYTYTIGCGGSAIQSLIDGDSEVQCLLGADANCIEAIWERMWWRLHYIGRGGLVSFAMSAVDIALWDLKGKARETAALETARRLLRPKRGPMLAALTWQLGPEELVEQTRCNLQKGFRAIKIKVGRANLSEDVERLRAVRQCIGPDMPLDGGCQYALQS